MSRFSDSLYLTERQAKLILKGREVTIWREKKRYTIALKPKNLEAKKILRQIRKLKAKLRKEEG